MTLEIQKAENSQLKSKLKELLPSVLSDLGAMNETARESNFKRKNEKCVIVLGENETYPISRRNRFF